MDMNLPCAHYQPGILAIVCSSLTGPLINVCLEEEPHHPHPQQGRRSQQLVILLRRGRPRGQMPAVLAMDILFVLESELAEMANDVLHLGIASATALTTEIVKP